MIKHLACIMDGNRRWARARGLQPWYGHKEGINAVKRVAHYCINNGIPNLSLYTFSLENFNRPAQELHYLFEILTRQAVSAEHDNILAWAQEHGVRIVFVGDRAQFPSTVVDVCAMLEQKTAGNEHLTIHLLFCYGGRQELVAGVKSIAHKVAQGVLSADAITEELVAQELWSADIPAPDLIIRTGGLQRLSNFLLYKAAYSELFFLPCLWPDITEHDLASAVTYFNTSTRNFGL